MHSNYFHLLTTLLVCRALSGASAENAPPLTLLGSTDMSNHSFTYEVSVNDNDEYNFTLMFRHDESYPIGTPEMCAPAANDTVHSTDSSGVISHFRFSRWLRYPDFIREATGVDHVSIDFNPCGHPPAGFLIPHYDIHHYIVSPEYRLQTMTCDLLFPEIPVCSPNQSDTKGQQFFVVSRTDSGAIRNMPYGFEANLDAVVHMGLHAMNPAFLPEAPEDWISPSYLMCSYSGQPIAHEQMFPLSYILGNESRSWTEPVTYEQQTIDTLPWTYTVEYDSVAGIAKIIFTGQSALTKSEFDELYQESLGTVDNNESGNGQSNETAGTGTSDTSSSHELRSLEWFVTSMSATLAFFWLH